LTSRSCLVPNVLARTVSNMIQPPVYSLLSNPGPRGLVPARARGGFSSEGWSAGAAGPGDPSRCGFEPAKSSCQGECCGALPAPTYPGESTCRPGGLRRPAPPPASGRKPPAEAGDRKTSRPPFAGRSGPAPERTAPSPVVCPGPTSRSKAQGPAGWSAGAACSADVLAIRSLNLILALEWST
jgi:hypothetical protein